MDKILPVLSVLVNKDLPNLMTLIDLVGEHPSINDSPVLVGAVDLVRQSARKIWDDTEVCHDLCGE